MDKIIVRTNADMQRVLDWAEQLHGMTIQLPFQEGEIDFQEELLRLRWHVIQAPIVGFELYADAQQHGFLKLVSWSENLMTGELSDTEFAAHDDLTQLRIASLLLSDRTTWKAAQKFRAIMLFAAYYHEDLHRTRQITRTPDRSRSRGSRKQHPRMLTTRHYIVDESMLGELPAPKREWHGYAKSFSVRGHYRHYKSGKVVWVRPFTKMGRIDKKSDTEYVL